MAYGITDITGMFLGAWMRAEKVTMILMESLQRKVAGYIDWNMILNSIGGPSYINDGFKAFIHVNKDFMAFHEEPLFFAMAHCAKITQSSARIPFRSNIYNSSSSFSNTHSGL